MAVKSSGTYPSHQLWGVSSNFQTTDASATSRNSPVSAVSAAATAIHCPAHAAEVVITPDEDIYISELAAMGSYDRLYAEKVYVIGCANMDIIYIKAVDAGANIYYRWSIV